MDIPCALSPRERAVLQRWARWRRVVEAGALLGGSTVTLASVAAHVTSIDRHEGYSGPTLRPYLANLDRYGVRPRVRPLVGDATALLPSVEADVGFLDLTGTYAVTLAALRALRAPVALVHDVGRPHCHGVEAAILTVGGRPLAHVDTLVVVELRYHS